MRLLLKISISLILFTSLGYSQTTDTLVAYQHFVKADSLLTNEKYEESIKHFEKALPVYEKAKVWRRVARCYNKISRNQWEDGVFDKGVLNAEKAIKTCEKYLKKNNLEEAEAYNSLGVISYMQRKYDIAIRYYERSFLIRNTKFGLDSFETSTAIFNIGLSYSAKEEYDVALKYFYKVMSIWIVILEENNFNMARCYRAIGIAYQKKGEYNKSIRYVKKALSVLIDLYGRKHQSLINPLNSIGVSYRNMGMYNEALNFYNQAIMIKNGFPRKLQSKTSRRMYNNIGIVYKYKGEYDKALEYLKKALQSNFEIYGTKHPVVALNYNNIGNVCRLKGEYDQALNYYNKALKIRESTLDKNNSEIAYSYNDIGELYNLKKEHNKAIHNINKALKIRLDVFGTTHPSVADSYEGLGNVYKNKEDLTTALTNYQKALAIRLDVFGAHHPKVALSYTTIANMYRLQGDVANSLRYYDNAIISNRKLNDKNSSYLDQNIVLSSLAGKAKAYKNRYQKNKDVKDLDKAIESYQKAAILINAIRQSFTTYQDKLTFAKKATAIYQGAIASHLLAYKVTKDQKSLEKAFYYSEKSKANTLKELLATANATNYAGLPKEVLELEKELRIDQAFYQSKIKEERTKQGIDSSKIIDYENRLFDISKRQDSLTTVLEKEYPKYHQLKHKNALVSVSDIQQKLKANTTLLEFFVSDSIVYAFTISKDKLDVKEITVSDLNKKIEALKESIIAKDIQEYKKVAYGLYSQLIAPIKNKLTGDELIIVPDGALWHCNFELLLTQQDSSNNPKSLPYLLKEFAISYANSASLLFQSSNTKSVHQEKEDCLAFSFSDSTTVVDAKTMSLATLRNAGDDLPGTRREIREISEIIDGQYYFGSQAIESNFKRNANRYNILHLALHGDVDHKRPENSKLYFTKSKDTIDDNLLYAHELFAMDIPAELTVLSACNTGTGKVAKGEGIMSLGSAFQYAGTKSLLLSSWVVSDQTTPELMKYFYTNLKEGMNKSKALQQAKLQYLQTANLDRVHPWYWGGFYVVGDTTAIQFSSNTSWYWILGIVLFVLILARFVNKRNSNKTKKLS
ncbi:CHAT domain-containing protein [Aquimarina sp. AD10]|uniref:tetratricopeptide repeat protein n=1 Tax=Aquimarina sp. AD10 TaxID=1714849 RepID=UPI000E4EAB20|nr:tetratricopeptide repeat protein [Aquimarina sp. AD10]AXT62501.1 CHAT domain-containing protein [Aquimarina sp. AD10]RKM90307.1 CHAT domain-containing protein [Aquimarina sp. AD10]